MCLQNEISQCFKIDIVENILEESTQIESIYLPLVIILVSFVVTVDEALIDEEDDCVRNIEVSEKKVVQK